MDKDADENKLKDWDELLAAAYLLEGELDIEKVAGGITSVLEALGEEGRREGLKMMPERVSKAYLEILGGYWVDLETALQGAVFEDASSEMVLVKDIEFYAMCEHHLLPFFGSVHVAYLPAGKLVGLSKIPWVVDMFARRLQVQERLTRQIADFLNVLLKPKGVAVVVEATQLCMNMRGIKKQAAQMVTTTLIGEFHTNSILSDAFFKQLG